MLEPITQHKVGGLQNPMRDPRAHGSGIHIARVDMPLGLTGSGLNHRSPVARRRRPGFPRAHCAVVLAMIGLYANGTVLAAELVASAVPPRVTRFVLDNGLQVSIIHVEGEIAVSAFTYLPNGLACDDPEHTLWARLLERLNTQLVGEYSGSAQVDHLALESWCRPDRWEQMLTAHAVLMRGLDFDEKQLKTYQEDVIVGTRWGEKDLNIHDVALALFAQGYRYGRKHVSIKREINAATLEDVRAYRDRHWSLLQGATLCVIGPVAPDQLKPVIVRDFGAIPATRPAATQPAGTASKYLRMSWDYETSLLVMAWPMGEPSAAEEAAMILAQNLLQQDWHRSGAWETFGPLQVAAGCRFPEGKLFLASLVARPGASLAQAIPELRDRVHRLQRQIDTFGNLDGIRRQMGDSLLLPNVPLIRNRDSRDIYAEALFNRWLALRRFWAALEWYYGRQRPEIGRQVMTLTPQEISSVARKYLTDSACIVCTIRPEGQRRE